MTVSLCFQVRGNTQSVQETNVATLNTRQRERERERCKPQNALPLKKTFLMSVKDIEQDGDTFLALQSLT